MPKRVRACLLYTSETKNSINYALLKDMPKGAMLVNTARKEVINEAELIKLMEDLSLIHI